MQIIIDKNTVRLDDEANAFLSLLKMSMTEEELKDWLTNWITSIIVPTLMKTSISRKSLH